MGILSSVALIGIFIGLTIGLPQQTQLLFANRKNICLVDVDGTQINSTVLVGGLEDAAAVDFIYDKGGGSAVYWTDVSQEAIKRVTLSTPMAGSATVISTGLLSPDGLACDWIGRKLYWTDSEIKRIEVSNLDGRMRKVLFWDNLDQPRAIVLYPQRGYMFWTDWGEVPKIERAGMDGDSSTRRTLISQHIFWPNGLTLDYTVPGGRLYWVDGKLNYINSCNLDGEDRTAVIADSLPHPFALTLFEDALYWTDWQTRAIYTCNKTNGSDHRMVIGNLYSPMDIHAFHQSRQPQSPNPCGPNNGGCSHLCLMSPSAPYYQCACPTGVRRLQDNKTCADGADEVLLLVRRTDLRWLSLDTSDYTDVVLDIRNVRHAIAIDYDPIDRHVYWSDDETRSIRRAYLDGTGQEVVVDTEIDRPDGIAVDWVARNIYWTDTGTDRIEVARLNGSSRRVLISENLLEPRAIVVDPVGGRMYWTDWGTTPKIERANLDGSDRTVLVNESLGWPNGLAIDYVERRIYWGDAKLDQIEMCGLDGSGRRVLLQNNLPHIFGLTLLGDYLYWTDWIEREVGRVHKTNGSRRSVILEQLADLMGLKAVNVSATEGENGCSIDNGGCSQLCLNRAPPLGHVCDCATGYELMVDGRTCIIPEAFLLYLRRTDIRRISLETSHNDAAIPLDGVTHARALDFDVNDNRIYWTDVELKSINRAFLNGSSSEHVVALGLVSPESVGIDWVAHNMYWADSGIRRIEMSHVDGSSRRVLVWRNVDPRSVAVNPVNGYLYWSNWLGNPRVERSALDGTGRTTFMDNVGGRIGGLAIDFDADRLYWANIDGHNIESVDLLTGMDRLRVVTNLAQPFGLTQFRDYIYWTDKGTRTIERADKLSGLNQTRLQSSAEEIEDISIFHTSRQLGWNDCMIHNGRCSHLCVALPNNTGHSVSFHCICPTHFTLAADNRTCIPPETFILFSQRTAITRILPDADAPEVLLPIQGLKAVRSLDFDPIDNVVYWIDGNTKVIRRAAENATTASVFVQAGTEQINPTDLAIDPYARTVYWSDSYQNTINVTRMDGSTVGVVVADTQARSIALAPEEGYLFWATTGRSQRIERAAADGTAKMTLFNTNIGSLGSIAIDTAARRIYWVDTDLKRIESGDFDGGHRQIVVEGDVGQPLGMYIFGEHLYWVDKSANTLERVRKTDGSNRTRLYIGHQTSAMKLTDVVVVRRINATTAADRTPCSRHNGGCSHLCVATGNGARRCSCPIGLMLSNDERTCSMPPTCSPDHFTCNNGYCIPGSWRCDGFAECEDDSDEYNCTRCATPTLFLCLQSGQCLLSKYRCDGREQCPGGSDELDCAPCDKMLIECGDRTCVDRSLRCDGHDDCADGSDEMNCNDVIVNTYGPNGTSPTIAYAIGIGVIGGILVLAFTVSLAVCVCRQKTRQQVVLDDRNNIVMVAKTTLPSTLVSVDDVRSGSSFSAPVCGILPPPPSTVSLYKSHEGGSESPLYDRDHITGASSSSLTTTAIYPKQTLNPPPSPVTERSRSVARDRRYAEAPVPKRHGKARMYSKRRRKHRIPPPPTTPCSTDVCDDSEPNLGGGAAGYAYYMGTGGGCCYESDPLCPPPPTPHSQYLSEEISCPPSPPSTERSFFISYPPPPPSSVFEFSDS